MNSIAVLDLGDGRRIHCTDVEAAKAKWAQYYPGVEEAAIDVFIPIGSSGIVLTYRYDPETADWVKSSQGADRGTR